MENDEKKVVETSEELTEDEQLKQENASYEAGIIPELRDVEIVEEVQNSFLDYAMSVIVSRALPDARDGLKPVHRRCIYGMYDAGYTPDKPFVKSAKIVGEVMGKYHPHGDAAIYNTIVRLAQNFSMRYTLADGHGNFGSMDGDEAAAMRYTECRMSKMALEMVKDLNCNTVDFIPNYDGTLEEPSVLPSRFPNLLVNGSDGIAVGMATKMPPHNLREIIDGIVALAHNPEITVEELMKIIKGPDFPTGGILYGLGGVKDAYTTGRGTFKLRARCHIEEMESGKSKIIITEIPYQVNKAALVAKIGELVKDKVVDGITSIRDFSKKNVCIEIECRRDVVPQVILNQLYKNTQLEVSFGVINLCIVDGAPKVLSLKQLLEQYLAHQINVITRRTLFLKKKDEDRMHIVQGLILAHDNIDEIIKLSKESENVQAFINSLMSIYGLSEAQSKAISAMTIGRLNHLDTTKLVDENNALQANIEHYNFILSSKENIINVILEELDVIKTKFGDDRRTEISYSLCSLEDEDLIPQEDIVITLTNNGYIKRMSSDEFKSQRRGGTGVRGMNVYSNDEVSLMVHSNTHTDILFFTSYGRVYRKRGHEINVANRLGKGIPVLNLLNLEKDEKVVSLISCDNYENRYLFFCSENGIVKRTAIEEFERINCNGKYALKFKEGDHLLDVKITNGNDLIAIATDNGMLALFNEDSIRVMGRTATGVRGIKVKDGGKVVACSTSASGDKVLVLAEKGFGKISDINDYRVTNRGCSGVRTIKITEKTGNLVGMKCVNGDEDILVITTNGTVIRTPLDQLKVIGRNTLGVKIINLRDKESVSSLTIVPNEPEEEEDLTVENPASSEETLNAEVEEKVENNEENPANVE